MKKLLALLAAFTMVLSIGTVALATGYEDWAEVPIKKNLDVTGENPAETFYFTVDDGSYEGLADPIIPEIDDFSITIAALGESGSYDISLPDFPALGVYTYSISETAGDTAGFGYDPVAKTLKVTVINNPNSGEEGEPEFLRIVTMTDVENEIKVDSFENSFDSSDLEISKTVSGNSGELDRYFEFKVTLTAPEGKTVNLEKVSIITPTSDAGNPTSVPVFSGGVSEFSIFLKHGETVSITNLPYGVTYTVDEIIDAADGYTVTGEVLTPLPIGEENEVSINNDRDTTIETGVNLDNLPYILLLAFAAGGLVIFAMRRRVTDR